MASRKRHRAVSGIPVVAPAAVLLTGWAHFHEPLHQAGFALLLLLGSVCGLLAPGVVVSSRSLHLLLVPDRVLVWHRRDRPRPAIPVYLRRVVLFSDGFRCCWCGSSLDLQIDHIKPWSRGGLNAIWNLMTLCGEHNRIKSNVWVARNGYTFYRPWDQFDNEDLALQMLRYELLHRWSIYRWMRAGLALILELSIYRPGSRGRIDIVSADE